jgi:hypothetical protein
MNKKVKAHLRQQRGIAMIVALLALVLLAAIGMALMFMADTENSVNNNYRDSQKAYFAARAGVEEARLLLGTDNVTRTAALALTMPSSGAPSGILYLKNPIGTETIDPTTGAGNTPATNPYLDDQLCWEKYTGMPLLYATAPSGPCGSNGQTGQLLGSPSTSFSALTMPTGPGVNGPDALPFKWVRITNKQNLMGPLNQKVSGTAPTANGAQICWNGKKEIPIAAGTSCSAQSPQPMTPVWQLTSLAATPKVGLNPGSRRLVQMEVAFAPPINPPAAVAAEAPIGMHGQLTVNGYDNCKCTATNAGRPGQVCDGSHLSVYSAAGVSEAGNAGTLTSGVANGLTTYNPDGTVKVQGSTAANQPWPYDVTQMISDYKTSAKNAATTSPWNFSCSGSPSSCGTQTGQNFGDYPKGLPDAPVYSTGGAPATVYVPGNVQLTGNASGSGILIIDGDLDVHGGLTFYGLILVKGQITFSGGGSSKVNMYGAMLAGEDVNAQDGTVDGDSIGGSFNFQYDSCALNLMPQSGPPKLLATHEIMY